MAQPRTDAQRKAMFRRMELSKSTGVLRGASLGGGKHPGQRVIREIRKPDPDTGTRYVLFYGGQIRKKSKKEIAKLARNEANTRRVAIFEKASPEVQQKMLAGSLAWQSRAKKRWIERLRDKIMGVTDPDKKARLEGDLKKLRKAPVQSPLTGDRPVSGYLKRYWS